MKKGKYVRGTSPQVSPTLLDNQANLNSPLVDKNQSGWKRYLPIFLIVVLTAIVYSFSLNNEATNWDDDMYIGENPLLKTCDFETVNKMFTSDDPEERYFMGNYHPLTMLTLNLNYQIADLQPNGKAEPYTFIMINIILHLISCVLVYLVFSQLFNKKIYPIVIALLFGIHTLHVESVTWIAERKDVLYVMFYFLALFLYILYKKQQKVSFYILSIIVFILSALSKGQAVSLTITLFLVDYLLSEDYLNWKTHLNKIPFFIISLIFGLISIKAQAASSALSETDQYELYQRIAFGSNGFLQYILRFILPVKLACLYPYPDILNRTVPVLYWLTVPIFIAILALSLFTYKKNKTFTFGLMFFIVNIALLLQFIPVGSAMYADRYAYIPIVGLSVLVAYVLELLIDKYNNRESLFYGIFGVYALVLCVLTVNREKVWQNSKTLWSDCLEKYPEAVIGWNNLGSYSNMIADSLYKKSDNSKYVENKKFAVDCFTQGIKYKPDYTHSYFNRGLAEHDLFENLQDTAYEKLAYEDFCNALKYDLNFAPAFQSRAQIYDAYSERFANVNKDSCRYYYQLSIGDYNRALELNPKLEDVYVNRGVANGRFGEYEKAIEDFDYYLTLKPNNASAYSNRGLAYNGLKQYDKSMPDFDLAIQLDPENLGAYFNRSLTNRLIGEERNEPERFNLAINDIDKCIEINPSVGYYNYLRGVCNLRLGKKELARQDFKNAQQKNYAITDKLIDQYCNN